MKFVLLIFGIMPALNCLQAESDHIIYRRDVSEILNKSNTSQDYSHNHPSSSRTGSSRSLNQFSESRQSNYRDLSLPHPSRSYLPAEKDNLSQQSFTNFNKNYHQHEQSKTSFQTDLDYSHRLRPISGHQTHNQAQIPNLFNPVSSQNDLNSLLALKYGHLASQNKINSYENHTPDNRYDFTHTNLQQNHFNTVPHQSQFTNSQNNNKFQQKGSPMYGHHQSNNFPTEYSPYSQSSQNLYISSASQPTVDAFNNSVLSDYGFKYNVAVEGQGPDFGHEEERRGETARGLYKVLLPDGRTQIVQYEADERGFRPKVSYEGRSYHQGSFQLQDPLSRPNINTIVTDLLNTDVKRAREQKASSSPYFPQQPVKNYRDDAHSNIGYNENINYGQNIPSLHVTTESNYPLKDDAYTQRRNIFTQNPIYPYGKSPDYSSSHYYHDLQSPKPHTVSPQIYTTSQINYNPYQNPSTSANKHSFNSVASEKNTDSVHYRQSSSPLNRDENRSGFLLPHTYGIRYSQTYANSRSNIEEPSQSVTSRY